MKTLLISGSPRKNGESAYLLKELEGKLKGEIIRYDAYKSGIKGCVDCRYCWTHDRCAFPDFKELDDIIREVDNIVIASPIYFSEVTGRLLDFLSKCQVYWSNKYIRKSPIEMTEKKGALILAYAGHCEEEKPYSTMKTLMNMMGVKEYFPLITTPDTDYVPASEDKEALKKIEELAEFLNR